MLSSDVARRITVGLIGATAVALSAACTTDIPTTPTSTVTATITQSTPPSPAARSSSEVDPPQSVTEAPADGSSSDDNQAAAPEPCGPRSLAPAAITAAIAKLRHTGSTWHVTGSNFSTCNDISYVTVDTVGTATPSPYQLMIFDRTGTFLGTGTACDVLYQEVVDSGPDAIRVRYNYGRPGEVFGSQTGAAYVTYRWNGSRVVMDGTLPVEVSFTNC